MLVCVGVSDAELRALGAGATLPVPLGFAATPAFLDAFGLDDPTDEDAERTLLYLAGLAALQRHGRRVVLVADLAPLDAPPDPLAPTTLGAVSARGVRLGQVSALFADDPHGRRLADAARPALAGLALEQAWEHPAHERLLAEADLAWFGPDEWAAVAAGQPGDG